MHEDKLTHDERLRLECIAQAVAKNSQFGPGPKGSLESVISDARAFEKYIKGDPE